MRSKYRRRSFLGYAVWGIALVGSTVWLGWEFDWLSNQDATHGTLDPNTAESPGNSGPADPFSFSDSAEIDAITDPIVFTQQTEPMVDGEPVQRPSRRSGIEKLPPARPLLAQNWDDPPTPRDAWRLELPNRIPGPPGSTGRLPVPRVVSANSAADRREDFTRQRANSGAGVVQVASTVEEPRRIPPELAAIDRQLQLGQTLEAHRALSNIYWNNSGRREEIKQRINAAANSIYFSPQPHYMPPYVIRPGDQLRSIARSYQVPWQFLEKLNRTEARRIRPGQELKVIKGPFAAVVDLDRFEMTVHHQGYFVRSYPVGIGKDGSTPLGKFKVLNKVVNPQYTAPNGQVVDADDPYNPLAERWIDLGERYGIHGTIDPKSIGRAESRGCLRLLNADVEEVYDFLGVGSEVVIQR